MTIRHDLTIEIFAHPSAIGDRATRVAPNHYSIMRVTLGSDTREQRATIIENTERNLKRTLESNLRTCRSAPMSLGRVISV